MIRLSPPSPAARPRAPSAGRVKELLAEGAEELGLVAMGIAAAEPLVEARRALEQWLDRGFHQGSQGSLAYLEKKPADRADPRSLLSAAKSVVSVAMALPEPESAERPRSGELRGKLARFACYPSYQKVLGQKLEVLAAMLTRASGQPVAVRACVDAEPLLERPIARRAGVGFVLDSALLCVPGHGTQVVLGELVVEFELEPDSPDTTRCEGCGACRKACPTGALLRPGVVEARRCVSFLTQKPGMVPRELRAGVGPWVFGCDVCQSVCPKNRERGGGEPRGAPLKGSEALLEPTLVELVWAEGAHLRRLCQGTRLGEARPRLVARNAAIALGNSGDERVLRPLVQVMREHPSPLVRAHAAWGLGNFPEGRAVLGEIGAHDPDPMVQAEARARLAAS